MLSSLEISNFRCFDQHTVPFRPTTFLVGQNNAGKSTIIEALRIVGIVENRFRGVSNYTEPPEWLEQYVGALRCMKFSTRYFDFPSGAIFNSYNPPPAKITARFKNNTMIEAYIGEGYETYGIAYEREDWPIQSRSEARNSKIPTMSVLPQLGLLTANEELLKERTIKTEIATNLSSDHFRNEIYLYKDLYFNSFKELSESNWELLTISDIEYSDGKFILMVRDGNFAGEVAWMGSGLKMWLQIMWFLARSRNSKILVLDEPDIYMHPDLQRRLAKIVRSFHAQVILTTHSAELLSEVPPEEVVMVDKAQRTSLVATDLKAVQRILDKMRSAQNLQLTRLFNTKRLLVVEGDDVGLLSRFHEILYPKSNLLFGTIPNFPSGGWDGWQRIVGATNFLRNGMQDQIKTYCIFDRDYREDQELEERKEKAQKLGVQLHIWTRKEIENYLISPIVFANALNASMSRKHHKVTVEEIRECMEKEVEKLKSMTQDAIANEISSVKRGLAVSNYNDLARTQIDEAWRSFEGKTSIVSGKDFNSLMFKWAQENYKVSLSEATLLHFFTASDIDKEVKSVVRSIETYGDFLP